MIYLCVNVTTCDLDENLVEDSFTKQQFQKGKTICHA